MTQLQKQKDLTIREASGKWLNSDVFRQDALRYKNSGFYTSAIPGTVQFKKYWDEQLRRCTEGYEVGGHKITENHYHYLNFCPIQLVDDKEGDESVAVKVTTLPDFWDGDFDYYWALEIARNGVANKPSLLTTPDQREALKALSSEDQKLQWHYLVEDLKLRVKPSPDHLNGGYHMIVGKSRRKGYSFKNAALCVNKYNTVRKSLSIIGAFDKKYLYPKGTMGMASDYMSFLNKSTAYGKAREYVDKVEHKKASYKKTSPSGISFEAGYMSEVMAITFADNPDAGRGKDAQYVLLEEAGAFPNLEESFKALAPALKAGRFITGQIIIFGTGGDMASGTKAFAKMFYNPLEFGLMPFINIWDENAHNSLCGFFHAVYMNMEGFYDSQGNSDIEGARAAELAERDIIIKESTSSLTLQSRVQEYPMSPSEAFLTVSTNDFPIVELRAQYHRVMRNNLHLKRGQAVVLTRTNDVIKDGVLIKGRVIATPDFDNKVNPIWDYNPKTKDLAGGVVIYEAPVHGSPKGLYKIGFDPYRQQSTVADKPSLASIYVYKSNQKFSYSRNTIVAQYVGRPYSPDDVNRIAEMLAELYGAEIMYENEVTHVKDYFVRRKKVHLLAAQPDTVISKLVQGSKVARIYGIHMNEKIKDGGEKYIKEWLLTVRDFDENGVATLNLETIYDPGLLEELILYNRDGNFDRVMSFMMVMFQEADEVEDKEYEAESLKTSNTEDLKKLMKTQFRNNRVLQNFS